MKKKKWLKRAAAVVLTAALCFGMTPIGNLPGISEVRADGTNLLTNGDFETLDTSGWEASVSLDQTWGDWEVKNDGYATNNTSYFLHLSNYKGVDNLNLTVTQSVSLEAGTYTATIASAGQNQGGSASNLVLSAVSGTETLASSAVTLGGWDNWTTSTITFTLTEAATVTVGVTGTLADSSYCDLDNATLVLTSSGDGGDSGEDGDAGSSGTGETGGDSGSSGTGEAGGEGSDTEVVEEGYKVTITPSAATVEAGDTVSLTAAVTSNGEAITDLAANNLYLWWWTDTWNDHTGGNSDAAYSNYDNGSGNSFTADVTVPSAGTYYIAAELKDGANNSILKTYVTITVTEPEEPDTSDYVSADINVTKIDNLPNDFIMGMDISSVVSEFKSGVTYKDFNGNTINNVTDFCKFLKTCGVTHVRVRIWNNPYDTSGNGYGGGNNDIDAAVEIAKGCQAAGLSMLLDFHCSDFWTDPGKQQAPKAWAGYTVDEKATALQTFLTESLTKVKATGADIAMVQIGNETTGGFIGETDPGNMCKLFNAGAAAVRSFDSNIKVVIHVTNPEQYKMTTWAKNLSDNNVDYDILATSYYPSWHGTFANLKSQLATVKSTYGKDVMVAETSYAFTLEDTDGHENTVRQGANDTMMCETQYPFSPQGQASYLRDLIAAVNEAGGIGVYWWESAWITVGDTTGLTGSGYTARVNANKALWEKYGSGWASSYSAQYDPDDAGKWYGGSAVDNQALFAADGSALDSVNTWKYVRTGAVSVHTAVEAISSAEETIEAGGTYTLPETVKVSYNGSEAEEPVTWSEADKSKIDVNSVGVYVVNGTVAFSKAVDTGDYAGKTSAGVTYTLTVKAPNLIGDDRSFENGSSNFDGLDSTGKGIDDETPYEGSNCLHWYLGSAGTGSVTYLGTDRNGITLKPGAYTFELMAQGNAGETVTLSILDHATGTALATGAACSMTGWAEWKTASVSFILPETSTVDLGITMGIQAGGWGTTDCMYLYQTKAYATYQVTFVDGTSTVVKEVGDGCSAIAPDWSKAGYSLGWDKSFAKVTSDITVNAVWTPIQYRITYVLDGGVNAAGNPAGYTVESGTVTLQDPTREGFVFQGWYSDESFENKVSSIQALTDGDITLYAKWKELVISIIDFGSGDSGSGSSESGGSESGESGDSGSGSGSGSTNKIKITVTDSDILADLIAKGALTSEEISSMSSSSNVSVYMTVEDVSATVSQEDANRIMATLASKNYDQVGCYLDLQLLKQIDSNAAQNITKLNQPIRIAITIPEDLRNTNPNMSRKYAVIRIHTDETGKTTTDLLSGSFDSSTNVLTFATDCFSTYAIVYKDTVVPSASGQTSSSGQGSSTGESKATPDAAATAEAVSTTLTSPDTSDNSSVAPFILMMAVAFVMMAAAAFAGYGKTRRRTR